MKTGPKQVVVLGGGFGGLHLVRHLERRMRRDELDLTLVDRQNYHLFTPLLYQVCTGELPPHAVAYPLRDATAPVGFRFLQTEVSSIDLEHRRVGTAEGELPYDHLVIALGSVTNDYGIPGVRENAMPVKWLADAEALKRHVLDVFESAATETDIARRREQLTFI
ncbi:MAG TPA: FAD-dependent oxidoreductase, partial [Gaiellaceae bacterium]